MLETVNDVRSRSWKEPLGNVMQDTIRILGSLSTSNTWTFMLGGSVAVASSLLNLRLTHDEVNKTACDILNNSNFNWKSESGEQMRDLLKKLKRYPSQQSELVDNIEDVRRLAQNSFDCVLQGIRSNIPNLYLQELDSSLKKNRRFENLPLCEGMLVIGSTFQCLVEDCRDLITKWNSITFKNDWFQLKVKTKLKKAEFSKENIFQFLNRFSAIKVFNGTMNTSETMGTFVYILLARIKLLFISITYHIFQKDVPNKSEIVQNVKDELVSFNKEHHEILNFYQFKYGLNRASLRTDDPSNPLFELSQKCKHALRVQQGLVSNTKMESHGDIDKYR